MVGRAGRGQSSVFVAVVFVLIILILLIMTIEGLYLYTAKEAEIQWEGEMSVYQPPVPVYSLSPSSWPAFDGYCLVNNVSGVIYYSCPSMPG